MNITLRDVPGPEAAGCDLVSAMLRAACDPRSAGPGTADTGTVPFGTALEQAVAAKMTCLLADWLTREDPPGRLSRAALQFLDTQLRAGRRRWQAHHREASRVTAALADAGIPAAVINGLASAGLLYGRRGTRQWTDADILIPDSTAAAAARILTGLGYVPAGHGRTALRTELGDPMVTALTVDLTGRLAHTRAPAEAEAALARRVTVHCGTLAPEPLPVLAGGDAFAHTLARLAARPRWPVLADALRYALAGAASGPLPPAAEDGWRLVRRCWPDLPVRPPAGTS